MTERQQTLVEQAERALRTARLVLEDGDANAATNRAYYACFYLAQAALVGVDEAPKTHSGTHTRFRLHFVADGPVSLHVGSILSDAFAARQRADYNTAAVTDLQAAADLLADAEHFVSAVGALVSSRS